MNPPGRINRVCPICVAQDRVARSLAAFPKKLIHVNTSPESWPDFYPSKSRIESLGSAPRDAISSTMASIRHKIRKWWRRRREISRLKSHEVYLFNFGPMDTWKRTKDENTRLGVWNGTYKLPEDR